MASITITLTHPQLSKTETLTVSDAKMVEFADLLRTYHYPLVDGTPITRAQAINEYAAGLMSGIKGMFRGLKNTDNLAVIPAPTEIDA